MEIQIAILMSLGILIVLCVAILVHLLTGKGQAQSLGQSFGHIREQLTQLSTIQEEIEQLSDLFIVPQTRGGIGETMLEELLRNWLPPKAYSFQHTFSSGSRVDAVIKLGSYVVPIDAKFPMETVRPLIENPRREQSIPNTIKKAVLKHIQDISAKYIRTSEGTLHFALMYIPSEKLYYTLYVQEDTSLLYDSLNRGVVPVSPSGLFLYVQTVAYGLRGLAMPEKQRRLVQHIFQLRKDFQDFYGTFTTAGTHLKNLNNAFEDTKSKLTRIEQTIRQLEATKDID
jgi:DNA recombination protein RmuC